MGRGPELPVATIPHATCQDYTQHLATSSAPNRSCNVVEKQQGKYQEPLADPLAAMPKLTHCFSCGYSFLLLPPSLLSRFTCTISRLQVSHPGHSKRRLCFASVLGAASARVRAWAKGMWRWWLVRVAVIAPPPAVTLRIIYYSAAREPLLLLCCCCCSSPFSSSPASSARGQYLPLVVVVVAVSVSAAAAIIIAICRSPPDDYHPPQCCPSSERPGSRTRS